MSRRQSGLVLAALALGPILIFAEAVVGARIFFWRDVHAMWYPQIESLVRGTAEGAWPVWNPYPAFGAPALADPSNQLAYPLTWLNLLLRPAAYYTLFVLVHVVGAGLGLFFLARRYGLSWAGALAAGVAWTTSGPVLSFATLYHHLAGLAWMPWVLLAWDAALERRTIGAALTLGAAVAAQVLAGSGDMCLMTGLVGVAWAVAAIARGGIRGTAAIVPLLRTGAVAAGFGLLLSAVQWLPTAGIVARSSRAGMNAVAGGYWSLHPAGLLDLLVPGLVARFPLSDPARAVMFESREPFLVSLYLGVGVLLLAGIALLLARDARKGLPAALAVAFLVLALGRHTPIYTALRELPPFSVLRYPTKYVAVASLGMALLAGLGLDRWLAAWERGQARRVAALTVSLLAVGLAAFAAGGWLRARPAALRDLAFPEASMAESVRTLWVFGGLTSVFGALIWARGRRRLPGHLLTGALVILGAGDLVLAGRSVNLLVPEALGRYRPEWLDELARGPSFPRVYSVPLSRERAATLSPPWDPEVARIVGGLEALAPASAGRWGLYGSYDGDFTGLAPPELTVLSVVVKAARGTRLFVRLLQLGSVDYVLSFDEEDGLGPPERVVPSVLGAPIHLYRVPDPLPRAFVVDGSRVLGEPGSYRLLRDPGFEPSREVILSEGVSRPSSPGFSGVVTAISRRADALDFDVQASGPCHLVVVDAFDAGWSAAVDGAPAPVVRANILFRAVPVPAGRHRVELRYRPAGVSWGSLLSGATLTLAGAAYGVRWLIARSRRLNAAGSTS